MTVLALALAPVLTDRTGAAVRVGSLDVQLLERAARDDYDRWLSTALQAGGCVQPIRLSGTVTDIDAATGEMLHDLDTEGRVHNTRRTCASLLVALDVHPRVAMQILRHSQIAVTMQVYSEVPSEATQDALRRLGQSLDGPAATAAPVAAQRPKKAVRASRTASDLVGDTGIEPVTSSV